jgi:hypothetical protein
MISLSTTFGIGRCHDRDRNDGLLALADVGVRIAEHLAVGTLGEEGEDAGLAAAALGLLWSPNPNAVIARLSSNQPTLELAKTCLVGPRRKPR